MDLDPHALRKHFLTVIKLSLLPWTFEFVLCAVMVFYFIDLPWDWGKIYFVTAYISIKSLLQSFSLLLLSFILNSHGIWVTELTCIMVNSMN